ncbi:MAG: hypothetical protein QM305_09880 [Bacteroidota bacterium]|jgi:hypothetical protein|nr:hypothetical protein [Bacteroidota bacterium]
MTDKDKMDVESQKALIEYRVQRARETLKEADVMKREYDDFVYCDKEMADDLYDKAISFVDTVCKLIEN